MTLAVVMPRQEAEATRAGRTGNAAPARPSPFLMVRQDQPLTLSLPEQIAARLGERIIDGSYQPGQRIQEIPLAAEFAVSRGPVREALRILEKEGLVAIHPRRGAHVTDLTVPEVRDIFEIRGELLGLAARLTAERATPELTRIIETGVARLAELNRASDLSDSYIETSFELSLRLSAGSGNPRLSEMIRSLALQTLRYTRLALSTLPRRGQSVRNWQALARAVRQHDPDAAEAAVKRLVYGSRDMATKMLTGAGKAAADQGPA